MNHVHKLKAPVFRKWVSSYLANTHLSSSKITFWPTGLLLYKSENPRLYGRKRVDADCNTSSVKIPVAAFRQAQAALLEYLHSTRSLHFMDAEHISKNSPHFVSKLLKHANVDRDSNSVGRSITRFLRYHPVNEFEPFFESMGLKPSEFAPYLPREFIFLSDCSDLLENYRVLCNYGVDRMKLGKIYKEASELFRYGSGELMSKIQAYEKMGLAQSALTKIIFCSPYILVGNLDSDFFKVLEWLKDLGLGFGWVEQQLSSRDCCNWSHILAILQVFGKMGYTDEQLSGLIRHHPGLIFDFSGCWTSHLIGFMIKFGSTKRELHELFLDFPQAEVEKFFANMRQCFLFLNEIDMEAAEVNKILRFHSKMAGSCTLKKVNSLLTNLNVGKKEICNIVKKDPQVLKSWAIGLRVRKLQKLGEDRTPVVQKTKFLLGHGFGKDSDEMKRALKGFRGKGAELQERFDCLLNAGLDHNDVCKMIRAAPQILNQTMDMLETKIDFLVNEFNYPLATLVNFPSYLSFKIDRIKLRLAMFKWLIDQGSVRPDLALGTIIACSDRAFIEQYVKRHPSGLEVWENLKKTFASE